MEVTVKIAEELRLTAEEFELITKLGAHTQFTELCAFSGMWNEHCSYKNSIKWLKALPGMGAACSFCHPGEENAGRTDMEQRLWGSI